MKKLVAGCWLLVIGALAANAAKLPDGYTAVAVATRPTVALEDAKPPADKAFYKVVVSVP